MRDHRLYLAPPADWLERNATRQLFGPYLGQPPPGREPVVFAPGVISTADAVELNAVFSSNGTEFLFTRRVGEALKIFRSRQSRQGLWTPPHMVEFSRTNRTWDEVDMWFTPGDRALLYISNAPAEGFAQGSVNIWRVTRKADRWGGPPGWTALKVLPGPINTDGDEIYPMVVSSGALYFSSTRPGGFGGRDLYVAAKRPGGFHEPTNLGPAVNSEANEGDVYVSPDESYLIVTSNRGGGRGKSDLYISFREPRGTWSKAVNLGAPINSKGTDYCPAVSPDERFFFFSRDGDVYWVDAEVLEAHRPR